jgi:hypothetical protein
MFDEFLQHIKEADLDCALKYMFPLFEKFGLLNFHKLAQDGLIDAKHDYYTKELIPLTLITEDKNQHNMDNLHFESINYG